MTIPLDPYVAPYKPLPQVTPFTYRDGITMLKKLDGMVKYINKDLVPWVNEKYTELGDEFETQVNALIEAVNAAIDLVINDSVDLQDPVMAQIFQDIDSDTRAVTDALYAAKSLETTVSGIQADIVAIDTAIATLNASVATINTQVADLQAKAARQIKHVKDYGAIGNGIADDTTAIQNAINANVPLYWGGPSDNYRITATITKTLTVPIAWNSDGAKVTVDSPTSIRRAFEILTKGFDVSIDGPIMLEANQKAFTGWYFLNDTTTLSNFTAHGLSVQNVFRANTTMSGGSGISIRGAYLTVNLYNPWVKNVTMAVNAGVPLIDGVSGISVTSEAAGMAPKDVNIVNPYIENVYSLDAGYVQDQDGIRIFTEENTGSINPFETHFNIRGGVIKNCMGRSIKVQAEFGVVDGVFMARRGTVPYNRTGTMPEIDFQTAGGIVSNCEFSYVSNTPDRCISWGGTLQVGGKHTNGIFVTNCKVAYSGSQPLARFMTVTPNEQAKSTIVVENVEVMNPASVMTTAFLTSSGGTASTELIIRIMNCSAPLDTNIPFYRRVGSAYPVQINLHNLAQMRTSGAVAKYSVLDNAGNYTEVTSGNNVRVAT